jgi:SAM-dependent methyltransferase
MKGFVMNQQRLRPEYSNSRNCETSYLSVYGDSAKGACYRSEKEARRQYALMLKVIRERNEPMTLLDFGCGPAHLYDYIQSLPDVGPIRYTGLDLSAAYIDVARRRLPKADLLLMNVLESDAGLQDFDYVIANQIFNCRGPIPLKEWKEYWRELVTVLFRHTRLGLAFDVMSKIVDWERDDLFHLSLDEMAEFVGRSLSRHFIVRHDYGKYHYTVFVYRTPAPMA